ncbi:MAG TPA: EamA family transporter, partial [Methylophilus sp.]
PLPNSMSDWLALSAGIGFSMTNVMTRHASYLSVAAKGMLVWVGVLGLSVVFVLLQGTAPFLAAVQVNLDWTDAGLLGVIALMLVSATLLVQYGVTLIPAIQASVLFMFELIVAAIAAYFLAGEKMSMAEAMGGLLILGAGIVSVVNTSRTGSS